MRIERTHDEFYVREMYKDEPKEYFKIIKMEIGKKYFFDSRYKLLDIGCATGGLLYYLRREFLFADLSGMDVMKKLLAFVNDGIDGKQIKTYEADISCRDTLPSEKYDVITMLGVLSIFDDFTNILDNVLSMLEKDGILLVFGIFNPEDIDILIRSRTSEEKEDIWESGWNYFSKASIEKYCIKRNMNYEWIPFKIGLNIEKRENDPLRSWTIDMKDGEKIIVNGLQIIHHFYTLKITDAQSSK